MRILLAACLLLTDLLTDVWWLLLQCLGEAFLCLEKTHFQARGEGWTCFPSLVSYFYLMSNLPEDPGPIEAGRGGEERVPRGFVLVPWAERVGRTFPHSLVGWGGGRLGSDCSVFKSRDFPAIGLKGPWMPQHWLNQYRHKPVRWRMEQALTFLTGPTVEIRFSSQFICSFDTVFSNSTLTNEYV